MLMYTPSSSPLFVMKIGWPDAFASSEICWLSLRSAEDGLKITKKDLDIVFKAQSDFLLETIAANEEVRLGDVCKIGGKHRDARKGRNPAANTEITIPARDGVPFAKFTKAAKE